MMFIDSESPYFPCSPPATAVAASGDFRFAAAFADHPHLFSQIQALMDAGGTFVAAYDDTPQKREAILARFPSVRMVRTEEELLDDGSIRMITAAGIPSTRAEFGRRVLLSGKDYFVDKAPFTDFEQMNCTLETVRETGLRYMAYFGERVHTESAWYLGDLIRQGVFGKVIHGSITGPHKLGNVRRPDWFFQKKYTGGILTDICSHQFDQFLTYGGVTQGEVLHARAENFGHPEHPEFEDYGEAVLRLSNGMACHSRVDWFTPAGTPAFGDGRTFLVGTQASAEVRKYVDPGTGNKGEVLIVTDARGEHVLRLKGKIGFPFFGQLILDCLNRTQLAMTQEHMFAASRLALEAQAMADAFRIQAKSDRANGENL